jgi:hypothetical protein
MTAEQIATLERQNERERDQLTKGQTICGAGCSRSN